MEEVFTPGAGAVSEEWPENRRWPVVPGFRDGGGTRPAAQCGPCRQGVAALFADGNLSQHIATIKEKTCNMLCSSAVWQNTLFSTGSVQMGQIDPVRTGVGGLLLADGKGRKNGGRRAVRSPERPGRAAVVAPCAFAGAKV